jgi:mRNA-degrading endonuclease toxin of MazEF toxin-antitoxin module
MKQNNKANFNPNRGDIFYADFGQQPDVITNGIHPCVICKKIGNIAQVIPITSYRGPIHWSEKVIPLGETDLPKDSIFKAGEIRPIGLDKIKRKQVGKLSREKMRELIDFIQNIILN